MLKIQNLTVDYGIKPIVEELSIDVEKGKMISILGPNGSGKSTVLHAVAKFIKKRSGNVLVDNCDTASIKSKDLAKKMCVLSQINTSPDDFVIRDLIYYGRTPHKRWFETRTPEDEEIIDWAIKETNLQGYEEKKMLHLSGGERQRVWIAMSLAQQPTLLLLDEPTTYLDISHQLEILELLQRLNQQLNITVVMVLHDLMQAATYSDAVAVLHNGKIKAYGKPEDVLNADLIRQVYNVGAHITNHQTTGKIQNMSFFTC